MRILDLFSATHYPPIPPAPSGSLVLRAIARSGGVGPPTLPLMSIVDAYQLCKDVGFRLAPDATPDRGWLGLFCFFVSTLLKEHKGDAAAQMTLSLKPHRRHKKIRGGRGHLTRNRAPQMTR